MLEEKVGVFSWKSEDMMRISRHIVEQKLKIGQGKALVVQKKRPTALERNTVVNKEVVELVKVGVLKETRYLTWVANIVMVKIYDGR